MSDEFAVFLLAILGAVMLFGTIRGVRSGELWFNRGGKSGSTYRNETPKLFAVVAVLYLAMSGVCFFGVVLYFLRT